MSRKHLVAIVVASVAYLALRRQTAPPGSQDALESGGEYWFDERGNIVDRYDPSTDDPIYPVDGAGADII